jgi:hypothetical protein
LPRCCGLGTFNLTCLKVRYNIQNVKYDGHND